MRAYQSRAAADTVQSTSLAKSSADRCAATVKSASDKVSPLSQRRVSASQPMYSS